MDLSSLLDREGGEVEMCLTSEVVRVLHHDYLFEAKGADSQGKDKPKFPVSRSARAGLQFPVGRWVSLLYRHIEPLSCHCFRDLITVIINRPQA